MDLSTIAIIIVAFVFIGAIVFGGLEIISD
jgi:hypothetical protein